VLAREADRRAVCLIQARYRPEAEAFVRGLAGQEGNLHERIDLVDGDISLPDLGLGDRYEEIARDVIEVYHLAAVYDLAVRRAWHSWSASPPNDRLGSHDLRAPYSQHTRVILKEPTWSSV
jgi:hypothetical protein